MYVVESEALNLIPPDELFHMTHLIEKLLSNNKRVGVYPIDESSWSDTGEWTEYKNTVEKLKYD